MASKGWVVMKWPPQSPDLNLIEMCWIDIDKQIKLKKPKNKDQLFKIIKEAWANISVERCNNLVKSMKRRCLQVIKNKRMATSY